MNRKALEKKIAKRLLSKIDGFEIAQEDYSSKFNHIISFIKRGDDLMYVVKLRFMKPNYLKLQVQFMVFSEKVNDELKEYINYSDDFGLPIINFDMEDYLSGLNNKNVRDFYIDNDSGLSAVNIEDVVEDIYQRYFSIVKDELIIKMGSLKQISELLNNASTFIDGKLKLSIYCFLGPFQILGGTMSALLGRDERHTTIVKKYWDYSLSVFQKGDNAYIDGYWRYMKKNHPELLR